MIHRRNFITLLSGAAAWPLGASAQQGGRVRRIGVLMGFDENDPDIKPRVPAFTQALAGLGWTDGRNAVGGRGRFRLDLPATDEDDLLEFPLFGIPPLALEDFAGLDPSLDHFLGYLSPDLGNIPDYHPGAMLGLRLQRISPGTAEVGESLVQDLQYLLPDPFPGRGPRLSAPSTSRLSARYPPPDTFPSCSRSECPRA
jgi:hypothetical protein